MKERNPEKELYEAMGISEYEQETIDAPTLYTIMMRKAFIQGKNDRYARAIRNAVKAFADGSMQRNTKEWNNALIACLDAPRVYKLTVEGQDLDNDLFIRAYSITFDSEEMSSLLEEFGDVEIGSISFSLDELEGYESKHIIHKLWNREFESASAPEFGFWDNVFVKWESV